MSVVLAIVRRELMSYFDSLMAYILLVLFLGFSGFFTWLYGPDVFIQGEATLKAFFSIAYWTVFFFTPALTMRLLAEEKKSGTIEWLLTKAVSDRQVVLGKFLAAFLLMVLALICTFPYVITLSNIGDIDAGEILCGYAGLALMSGAYISIGLYASSTTNNQIVAFLIAMTIGLFFHIIFDVLAGNLTGFTSEVFRTLSMGNHVESLSRGVVDTRDVIYFGSIIFVGLFFSELSLTKRNLS